LLEKKFRRVNGYRELAQHNSGKSIHANKFKPWNLLAYVALPEKQLAEKVEKYLKSGSGRALAKRHLQR
jgi:predicted GIY-YIG superfamily endonuclease